MSADACKGPMPLTSRSIRRLRAWLLIVTIISALLAAAGFVTAACAASYHFNNGDVVAQLSQPPSLGPGIWFGLGFAVFILSAANLAIAGPAYVLFARRFSLRGVMIAVAVCALLILPVKSIAGRLDIKLVTDPVLALTMTPPEPRPDIVFQMVAPNRSVIWHDMTIEIPLAFLPISMAAIAIVSAVPIGIYWAGKRLCRRNLKTGNAPPQQPSTVLSTPTQTAG